jgi:phosphonate transport system substrate-binding protein
MIAAGGTIEQALNDATGLFFQVTVPSSYTATIEEMCASPDDTIGFLPAIGYVLANQLCDVEPVLASVRFGWNMYWTAFFVARDSDFQTLYDLEGAIWAYPDPGSTSGFIYPISIFNELGIEPGLRLEAGGHPQAVEFVYLGLADVGTAYFSPPLLPSGSWSMLMDPDIPAEYVDSCAPNASSQLWCGDYRVLDARASISGDYPDVVQQVRILTLSHEIPNDTIAFSSDFPNELKPIIINALRDFIDPENLACANSVCSENFYNITEVAPISDANFDGVRILVAQQGITLESLGQ